MEESKNIKQRLCIEATKRVLDLEDQIDGKKEKSLEDILEDLDQWDGQGVPPHVGRLEEWGLWPAEDLTVDNAPVLKPDTAQLILDDLNTLIESAQDHNDSDHEANLRDLQFTLRWWMRQQAGTPFSRLDELESLGLWPPHEAPNSDASDANAVGPYGTQPISASETVDPAVMPVRDVAAKADALLAEAKAAYKNGSLLDLHKTIHALNDMMETARQLSWPEDSIRQLSSDCNKAAQMLQDLMSQLGQASRTAAIAQSAKDLDLWAQAYQQAGAYMDAAFPVAVDAGNLLGGGAQVEAPTSRILAGVAEGYIHALFDVSDQALQKASGPADPGEPREWLQEAIDRIDHAGLQPEHRHLLDMMRLNLQNALNGLNQVPEETPLLVKATLPEIKSSEGSEAALPEQIASEPPPFAQIEPATPAPDEEIESQFAEMQKLRNEGSLASARNGLESLVQQAAGEQKTRIEQALSILKFTLSEKIREAKRTASEIAEEQPGNLAVQEQAWRAVLRIDLDDGDALLELDKVLKRKFYTTTLLEVTGHLENADQAQQKGDLRRLNEEFGWIETIYKRAVADHWPSVTTLEIKNGLEKVQALRDGLRITLGRASTLLVEGQSREAYVMVLEALNTNKPILVDSGNLLDRGSEAEVSPAVLFSAIAGKFITNLRDLADQRLNSANGQLTTDPKAAVETLQEAHRFLTDDVIIEEHRRQLTEMLNLVNNAITHAEENFKKFSEAKDRFASARRIEGDAKERLRLLCEAEDRFPFLPGLKEGIENAMERRASELATRLGTRQAVARSHFSRYEFSAARDELSEAIVEAHNLAPAPATSDSPLGKALKSAEEARETVLKEEAQYNDMLRQVQKISEAINRYENAKDKDEKNLAEARASWDVLNPEQRDYPLAKEVQEHLRRNQSDQQNITEGWQAYRKGEWEDAANGFAAVAPAHAEYAEMQRRADRAMAAQKVVNGNNLRKTRRLEEAYDQYRAAYETFFQEGNAGADNITLLTAEECKRGIDELADFVKKVRQAQAEVEKNWANLQSAVENIRRRATLRARLDPPAGLPEVISALMAVQQPDVKAAAELGESLNSAREEWRTAYLASQPGTPGPIQAALESNDIQLMALAKLRLDELYEHGLLYNTQEQDLNRRVQAGFLDQQYRMLMAPRYPDWGEVEKNRRDMNRQVSLMRASDGAQALELENRQKEVNEQLKKAVLERINADLVKCNSHDACDYLERQLEIGVEGNDLTCTQRLVEIYWALNDWNGAVKTAHRFQDRLLDGGGAEQSRVWTALSRAGQKLEEDNIDRADSILAELQKANLTDATKALLKDKYEFLKQHAFERLVDEATQFAGLEPTPRQPSMTGLEVMNTQSKPSPDLPKARRANRDEELILAIEKCVLARKINPKNEEVKTLLTEIGVKIQAAYSGLRNEAVSLNLSGRSLDDAIRTGEILLKRLKSIAEVASDLRLDDNTCAELEDSTRRLELKVNAWLELKSTVEKFEDALLKAVSQPRPIDNENGGCWQLEEARTLFDQAKNQAARARENEMDRFLEEREKKLLQAELNGQDLSDKVTRLMKAVSAENFDQVILLANDLEKLWNDVNRSGSGLPWKGLEDLVLYIYRDPLGEVRQVRGHREAAAQQKNDLVAWESWAKQTREPYDNLEKVIKRLQNRPLQLLKSTLSLETIVKFCEEGEAYCQDYRRQVGGRPTGGPLSDLAQQYSTAAGDDRQGKQVDEWQTRFVQLRKDAGEEIKALKPLLEQLNVAINNLPEIRRRNHNKIPQTTLDSLKTRVEACEKIDSHHPKVVNARQTYEDEMAKV